MSLFDFFRRTGNNDAAMRDQLVQHIMKILTDKNGRVRVEDTLCTAATIVGERCIDAAGDFSLREHDMAPGTRAFSTKANELICGDDSSGDIDAISKESVIGVLRDALNRPPYHKEKFPALSVVFAGYAARVGEVKDWGKVPLSVPEVNLPFVLPLQVGFETRDKVDEIFREILSDKMRCLRVATEALADLLNKVSGVIDPALALLLSIETINGMAKTAPMTKKAMANLPKQHS
jgi:hypothetical protein